MVTTPVDKLDISIMADITSQRKKMGHCLTFRKILQQACRPASQCFASFAAWQGIEDGNICSS